LSATEGSELLEGVDVIVHLAAANELRSSQDPEAAMLETCGGTRRLLELAISRSVDRFLFMSTVHVYGSPLKGHYDETTPTRAAHPYSVTHKAAEDYVLAARDAGKIDAACIRLSNAIGAPAWTDVDRWTLVGNDLARQAVNTSKMLLRTPGQWRDFMSMQDVCLGIELLLGEIYPEDGLLNLGGDYPARIIEIAEMMKEAARMSLGKDVTIVSQGAAEGGTAPQYTLSTARMRQIGFAPSGKVGLEAEFQKMFALLAASGD
jgi:UDP-glucose 4-epimerase